MPLLPEREKQQVRELFERDLQNDVQIDLYTQKPSILFVPGRPQNLGTNETQELISEVAELSPKLQLQIHDVQQDRTAASEAGVDQTPTLILKGENAGTIRFLGSPAGYEFSTLIADLVDLSAGNVLLTEETQAALREIDEPVHIRVFSTPT
jgi:alkyl hydroperoxide reductase subunit AhpF